MKNITESLKGAVNEARQIEYRVSLVGVQGADGMPASVSILVNKADQRPIEDWLESQQDELFAHANGGNIEY